MAADAISDLTAPVTHDATQPLTPIPAADPPSETPPDHWVYDGSDPALMLFTAAVARFGLTFPPGSRVLELGCAESDWLERMHALDPTLDLTGVDARWQARAAHGWTLVVGDACRPNLFPEGWFDRIVLLGALEHFGLGFYGDPVVEDGDTRTMANVARWLAPGGLVYFDVPCNPTSYITENRHFRCYSPAAVGERLIVPGLVEVARGYSDCEPHAGTWCAEPVTHHTPYHFVAVVARKDA